MMRLIKLTGVLLLCALLMACGGTIRAIEGDYGTDAAIIRAVRPTAGVSGEEVQFELAYCTPDGAPLNLAGEPGMTFIWDFGTGAEPNTSFEESPIVTLRDGLRAPYECRITARGTCFGEEENQEATYTFTLDVAALGALGVSPSRGMAGTSATFSVVGITGAVTTYAWNFGGGCDPAGSTDQNPTVRFVESPGTYYGSVVIGNRFEVLEVPFTIVVDPNPGAATN